MSTPPYPLACSGGGTFSIRDGKCQTGETQNKTTSGQCPPGLEQYAGTPLCGKLSEPCPSGSKLTMVFAKDQGPQNLCIPNSAQLGSWVDAPSDQNTWPCQSGVNFLEFDASNNKLRCITNPSNAGTGSTAPGPVGAETTSSSPATIMAEVNQSLRPFRPPTAPTDDLERERRGIASISSQQFLMIQVSLFIVVLVLIAYIVVPQKWAHTVAFLLIVVGIAVGFFLPK